MLIGIHYPTQFLGHKPVERFRLDENKFATNLRKARRGAASGPSGMTTDHLPPVLDNPKDNHLFFMMGEQLAQGRSPQAVNDVIRLGRMTALQKSNGGVRGIVAGDVVRSLGQWHNSSPLRWSRQQPLTSMPCPPGTECVAHALQALTELDLEATIVSIDGVGAYDSISRKAMLEALIELPGGSAALPFVRVFLGQPSRYLWEDESGMVHTICQGEGGEQGDALMPLLFSLGQHAALEAVHRRLMEGERLFAFLDGVYVVTTPRRVGDVHLALQEELFRHSRILINTRHRCGMQVEFAPKRATCLKESRKPTTPTPGFGEDRESQQQSVASAFWARLWDMQIMCGWETSRSSLTDPSHRGCAVGLVPVGALCGGTSQLPSQGDQTRIGSHFCRRPQPRIVELPPPSSLSILRWMRRCGTLALCLCPWEVWG